MTDRIYTEAEVLLLVERLTRPRLRAFVEAELVRPEAAPQGSTFRAIDLARLELLCDLADDFELESDALGVVIGLLDQLHEARGALRAMAEAMATEPVELRSRVGARLVALLSR